MKLPAIQLSPRLQLLLLYSNNNNTNNNDDNNNDNMFTVCLFICIARQ